MKKELRAATAVATIAAATLGWWFFRRPLEAMPRPQSVKNIATAIHSPPPLLSSAPPRISRQEKERRVEVFSRESIRALRARKATRSTLFEKDSDVSDPRLWKVRWHQSCQHLPQAERFSDLRLALSNNHLDSHSLFPNEGRVLDWNRYFQHPQGVYLQLSANWQATEPTTFSISIHISNNIDFSGKVIEKFSPHIPKVPIPWPEAKSALEEITHEIEDEGYVAGKRTVLLSGDPEDRGDDVRVEALGALPRLLQLDTTFCLPENGYLCYCDANTNLNNE